MKALSMVLAGMAGTMCAMGSAPALQADEAKVVQISDKGFSPERLEIQAGQKVAWKNMTTGDHNVTCTKRADVPQAKETKPLFDSGVIKAGASFEYTFKDAGTYEYTCSLDKSMKGTVVVRAAK